MRTHMFSFYCCKVAQHRFAPIQSVYFLQHVTALTLAITFNLFFSNFFTLLILCENILQLSDAAS